MPIKKHAHSKRRKKRLLYVCMNVSFSLSQSCLVVRYSSITSYTVSNKLCKYDMCLQ